MEMNIIFLSDAATMNDFFWFSSFTSMMVCGENKKKAASSFSFYM